MLLLVVWLPKLALGLVEAAVAVDGLLWVATVLHLGGVALPWPLVWAAVVPLLAAWAAMAVVAKAALVAASMD